MSLGAGLAAGLQQGMGIAATNRRLRVMEEEAAQARQMRQMQIDEMQYAKDTREQAGLAYKTALDAGATQAADRAGQAAGLRGLDASMAPEVQAARAAAPQAEFGGDMDNTGYRAKTGAMQTDAAYAASESVRAAPPTWIQADAMRASAASLMQRGKYQEAAALEQQANASFDNHMKQTSNKLLMAIEQGDYAKAAQIYDSQIPDGYRIDNLKVAKDGSMTGTVIGAEGNLPWKGNKDELRAMAIGLTDPAKIQELRDKAMERESALYTKGVGAALQGDMATARKVLGGDVKIENVTNEQGVADQRISLPDGRQVMRSAFEKVAPWAMQKAGLDIQDTKAGIDAKKSQTRQNDAQTDILIPAQAGALKMNAESSRISANAAASNAATARARLGLAAAEFNANKAAAAAAAAKVTPFNEQDALKITKLVQETNPAAAKDPNFSGTAMGVMSNLDLINKRAAQAGKPGISLTQSEVAMALAEGRLKPSVETIQGGKQMRVWTLQQGSGRVIQIPDVMGGTADAPKPAAQPESAQFGGLRGLGSSLQDTLRPVDAAASGLQQRLFGNK